MKDAEARAYAEAALMHWGIEATPRLIKNRENAVFETVSPEFGRVALRLHRPGYQSDAAIRSELWWAEALVAAGVQVPLPVRTKAEDVIADVPEAGRRASIVTWMDGAPLGEGDVPLDGSPARQAALHHALGAELARLHAASDEATLPEAFERGVLDRSALLGDDPAWGRFWENPALSREERTALLEARERLCEVIGSHEAEGDFGLIHADALRENVMVQGDAVRLIDFDDGVFGFRMYELGVAMSQNWDQPNRADLGAALLEGYGTVRPLPGDAALLEAFTVMRGLASCGWVIGRYAPDAPETADYAARAVKMAREWLRR
ncbi:phosphotransferase enzyme family protein [Shimia aestuarii]|uniref:phosphotransferase enzyme family protein n=1 Tax=Shimia aestuarii TaxID=254406 RepID=UPI001FB1D4C6|nr:phosphotransferase [Shimia aestuarii]